METALVATSNSDEMRTKTVTLLDLSKVVVTEITYETWLKTREADDQFDNDVALIAACTKYSVEDIDSLLMPDLKELLRACIEVNDPTAEQAKSLKPGQTDITLMSQVTTVLGETTRHIQITMPNVKAGRELNRIKESHNRIEYMIKATTRIADTRSMRMSDYSLLVMAVPDFFALGAAYFLEIKSNNSLLSSM